MEILTNLLSSIGLGVATNAIYDLIITLHGKGATRNEWEIALAKISEINGRVDEVLNLLMRSNVLHERNNIVEVDGTHIAQGKGTVIGLDVRGPAKIKPGTVTYASGEGTIIGTRIGG
ncbi:hypothetical protein L5L78_04150 [Shewanella sp. SM34]|uniref:hypothetical protein n=1 Tax=unclassified Shewanella TaxID=196818 RepID=UPI0021DA0569|nr:MULTISPECIES: hypothetical protein [unclassified Shewanella]MCU8055403.1 hypothetical protein [Shewanella sp. SM35]MCU8064325.1 hypothetical protein [Shewanella sp. SM34]